MRLRRESKRYVPRCFYWIWILDNWECDLFYTNLKRKYTAQSVKYHKIVRSANCLAKVAGIEKWWTA